MKPIALPSCHTPSNTIGDASRITPHLRWLRVRERDGPAGMTVETITPAGPLRDCSIELSEAEVAVDEGRRHLLAVDGGFEGVVLQPNDLLGLLKQPFAAHRSAELVILELLQFGLLEIAAADAAYTAGGVDSLLDSCPINGLWRAMHGLAQTGQTWTPSRSDGGRVLLGVAPSDPRF